MSEEPHEVPGVEYVPVCDQCWEPVEEHEELINGRWEHAGYWHRDPALNPTTRPGALPEEDE